ncbi:unnamed protein product [[Candida] boidinii]|uniref:phosphoadenylyl-sulfate reductase (thioredoxin) n=1 Tax=Candida boidinii TaxID=5477 RepID=A0A9W6SVB2_CANBO|nr:hypothetical protein BVG19_g4146 [[Candida] boidinii]OWB51138.1 hypothetical protein B5S27_g2696 [[Candida] boidinii]OWB69175.1 hypothetical protein B5S30_g4575 [[Candida] boidinii]OWB86427.1 hypothetical protein B5S33_g5122 [[Candida] boidinii]GME66972.1 unnamed protein product [[Candida] boidinii]
MTEDFKKRKLEEADNKDHNKNNQETNKMTTDNQISVKITKDQLDHLNNTLSYLTPQEVLKWSIITFPNLFQTTAFGLTGLAILDMLHNLTIEEEEIKEIQKSSGSVELIFIDTLYHFPQTYELISKIKSKYSNIKLNIYKPKDSENEQEFVSNYGDNLWETNDDKYDYLVKVEPAQRAYKELKVVAVFTGRRRSQGGARGSLPVIEIEESSNIIKINPLASWDFNKVLEYIKANDVPYNELLDLGYKSVGDWHSTQPVKEGEDERSGRWKGKAKTECGIHETSRFAQFLKENENKTETGAENK